MTIHSPDLVLASTSAIRLQLLRNAGLSVEPQPARVDEDAIRAALPHFVGRDLADALAEAKARKVAQRLENGLVLGCDQVLECEGRIYEKPPSPEVARDHLRALMGRTHKLVSAAVLYEDGEPVWRHVGEVRLHMRALSPAYIDDYVARNWDEIRHSVGAYQLEQEGARLFEQIEGDYFSVLGLPLIPLLSYLAIRGVIAT